MFYSHEVLTQRKYGVATVWLVATLGSKSTLKKVGRKQILDVNIPRACQTVITPEVPMALRLQSNLLYGVSRVYSQQCGYVLADAQSVQASMRQLFKVVRTADLDIEEGRAARPDQLMLQDDPSFLPDFAFGNLAMDLSNLEIPTDASSRSESILSPRSGRSSRTSQDLGRGILIPASSSDIDPGLGGFDLPAAASSDNEGAGLDTWGQFREDDGFLPDADFTFDEAGDIQELGIGSSTQRPPAETATVPRSRAASDISTQAAAQVAREQKAAQRTAVHEQEDIDMEDVMPPFGDDFQLPEAEPFPEVQRSQDDGQSAGYEEHGQASESLESAAAPHTRKKRTRKPIEHDRNTELRSAELNSWNINYLANMEEARKRKLQGKSVFQAKKNAEWFLWGVGLGGIGAEIGHLKIPNGLEDFYGDRLKSIILGGDLALQRVEDEATDEGVDDEGRRKRIRRASGDEVGRGQHISGEDHDDFEGLGLAGEEEPEAGRDAPTPLGGDFADVSSSMPWNRSAASSATHRAAVVAQQQHRSGRTVSASPLVGRGSVLPHRQSRQGSLAPGFGQTAALEGPSSSAGDGVGFDDLGEGFDEQVPSPEGLTEAEKAEWELFGPGAQVDTQTAAASQWVREKLDHESVNFLEFVGTAIAERNAASPETLEVDQGITFEALLPPTENTRVVAAQGMLHLLTLATRNLLDVAQEESYGAIQLTPITPSRAGEETEE